MIQLDQPAQSGVTFVNNDGDVLVCVIVPTWYLMILVSSPILIIPAPIPIRFLISGAIHQLFIIKLHDINNIKYYIDKSNNDKSYTRNRIRMNMYDILEIA